MVPAVTFYTFVLAAHIASIVIAFGVTFAYPVMYAVGLKREPQTMPGFHRIQDHVGRFVITPFLALALLCGIYLASKLEVWSDFYVQWGLAAIIVLGGLGGAFFAPRERKLAELADRDLAQGGTFSPDYMALRRQVAIVGYVANVLVLLTIYFMTAQTGA
jgi:Predicted integral membrane protein (DUF2269)